MPTKNENEPAAANSGSAGDSNHHLQVDLRLKADAESDRPVFSNFTTVQGAPGVVFIDFGFLEPAALPSIARLAQSGGKMPSHIEGRLACRVALGMDSAAQLANQLNAHLKKLASSSAATAKVPKAAN